MQKMMNGLRNEDCMKLLESSIYKNDLKKVVKNIDLDLLKEKSIFITGGLGLICSAIVDVLLIYGKTGNIYIGARDEKQFKNRFGGIEKVIFIQYDALKNQSLDILPDYIIHGAGLASPELYTAKPVETILSNFQGLQFLLEFAKKNNIERLLYISSSEVYGKKNTEESFKEDMYGQIDIDNIRSSYAVAKKASEMLCKTYYSEYNVDMLIVRPGHIYGPSAKKTDKRISSDFALKAANGEKLVMKSSGLQNRSYCYSLDCAAQILEVLLKGKSGQAYNVGHDEITTIRKMSQIFAKAGNVELSIAEPTEEEKKSFNPMNNASLDNSKVKELGYKDTFTVEEGLMHTVKILKEMDN
jgi:nucleoside-diphosphate-sugar epimerase